MEEKRVLHIVSHTHWDREWYLSFQKFRRRFVKLMDRLINLLENDLEFNSFHLDGQFQTIKDYLEIRPENEQRIRKLVKAGKLIIGPWYTQPTESLVSGEALIRNLMLGIRECKRFGAVSDVCYLPDEFGNVSQLPQICRGFGYNKLISWRGLPRGSKSVFRWEGSDGSEVMMYYLIGSYGDSAALPLELQDFTDVIDDTPISRDGLLKRIKSVSEMIGTRGATKHVLLMNGIDHSFAQENICEVIKLINQEIPEVHAIHSSMADYTNAVLKAHEKEKIPFTQFKGEMFDPAESPVLLDCHSTHVDVKMWNNKIENLYEKWMEPFAAYAWLLGYDHPTTEMHKAWEYLLDNQFHDSIDSSCNDAAYHQILTRFENAYDLGEEIVKECMQFVCNSISSGSGFSSPEKALVIFNPSSWERNEIIYGNIDIPEALNVQSIKLMDGMKEIPMVISGVTEETVLRYNPYRGHPTFTKVKRFKVSIDSGLVPSHGYKVFKIAPCKIQPISEKSLVISNNSAENMFFEINFNPNGTFNVLHKETGILYKNLHYFMDEGEAGNGFEHEIPTGDEVFNTLNANASISLIEDSALRTVFNVRIKLELPRSLDEEGARRSPERVECYISSDITIMSNVARIDIKTTVDNRAKDHRLRVVFPTGINTDYSYAVQPFDVVKRDIALPDLKKSWVERPRPTHGQQSFVDISDGKAGMMIANRGIYEYEVTNDETRSIILTLLRCTDKLYQYSYMLVDEGKIPEAQCLGEYTLSYSIIPHQDDWEAACKQAWDYNTPMMMMTPKAMEEEMLPWYKMQLGNVPFITMKSWIEVQPEGVIVTAIKKHETNESLIVRLWNTKSEAVKGNVRIIVPNCKFKEYYFVDLNECRQGVLVFKENEGWVEIEIKGKGLVTLEATID